MGSVDRKLRRTTGRCDEIQSLTVVKSVWRDGKAKRGKAGRRADRVNPIGEENAMFRNRGFTLVELLV